MRWSASGSRTAPSRTFRCWRRTNVRQRTVTEEENRAGEAGDCPDAPTGSYPRDPSMGELTSYVAGI
jgi:hypothetical protein